MTHMLPNGCFGSSLAYAPKSAACSACPAKIECGKKVNARYPNLIKLLQRFTDCKGKKMAEQWLSPTDKKRLKERRRLSAQRQAELATFGDPAAGSQLRATLEKRAHPILDRCIDQRINPLTADLRKLRTVSEPMNSALAALLSAPQHRDTIANSIASDARLSATTAKRETDALLAFLKRCGRIALKNNIAEIQ